ncbi:MAG TPA: TlpA disulfide reductase family protein [Rubricoccaceae bacterium]|jgi:thiol-disulfide isomerase/thioredoxin
MRLSLSVLVLLAGCGAGSGAPAGPPAGTSALIEVADASALVESVAGLGAEAVVLNFWATWCGPCRSEFPTFVRYDAEQAGQGVEVRFVSLDTPGDLPAVRAFLDEHGVSEPSYVYTGEGDVTSQLNPFVGGAIPITMVLDGDGIVQHTTVGTMSYDDLSAQVESVRRGERPAGNAAPAKPKT